MIDFFSSLRNRVGERIWVDLQGGVNVTLNDITKKEQVRDHEPLEEGTGIYWFVDDAGRVEKLFAPRVTRARAGQIATDLAGPGRPQSLDAYRWIPERVEGADKLISTQCAGGRCASDSDCFDNACHCVRGFCQ
jgi:hypothetical protein